LPYLRNFKKRISRQYVWIVALFIIPISGYAQKLPDKSINPFKNPYGFRSEKQTPAFRGWNLGFNYANFTVRRISYVPGTYNYHFLQKNINTPEFHIGYRAGKRLFGGIDFHFGKANYSTVLQNNEFQEEATFTYDMFTSSYVFSIGFSLEPFKTFAPQVNAIVLSAFIRDLDEIPGTTIKDLATGQEVANVYTMGGTASLGFQLAYERVIYDFFHVRIGPTYTLKGSKLDWHEETKAKLGFHFGGLVQF